MSKRQLIIVTCIFWIILIPVISNANDGEVIFSESFESCIPPDWSVDNGIWECCIHNGSEPWGGGSLYAATICDANYLAYTDSRIISPEIQLPGTTSYEELHLRFWHRFSYSTNDVGYVQIQVYDGAWSAWTSISNAVLQESAIWTQMDIDLTAYANQMIRIAFFHSASPPYESDGWRIDDIFLTKKTPEFTGDFECGWEDWSADRGVWEVGKSSGPPVCYSGGQCAGTVLNGNYPASTDTRLVSPTIEIPINGGCEVCFHHWLSYSTNETAYVQIQTYDDLSGLWSAWIDVEGPFTGISGNWFRTCIDLSTYAGQKVRIAFYHTADPPYESSGWYVDQIRINCDGDPLFSYFCECDLNQSGECNILDYQGFIQDWGRTDCGTPPGTGLLPNDCECDLNKDGDCNILDYQRFIQDWGNMFCEVCP